MFSKHYDDGNRDLRFSQNGNPLFSEKAFLKEAIILKTSNGTIMNNHKLAETVNTFFSNITQNLQTNSNLVEITQNLNTFDPLLKAIKKYGKHPSIIKIKEKMRTRICHFLSVLLLKKQF